MQKYYNCVVKETIETIVCISELQEVTADDLKVNDELIKGLNAHRALTLSLDIMFNVRFELYCNLMR